MVDELVFAVKESEAVAARPVTFAEAGLRERDHFQEWVLQNAEILGPNVMIITAEFDRWVDSSGQSAYDRLDVLGLDDSGHLVVAELKRDRAPDSVTMQALNYTAMVSRFSLDDVSEVLAESRSQPDYTERDALAELQAFAPGISDESLGAPRVHLLASEFGPTVTNLALYLYENGIDIRLSRVQPYETPDGRFIVTVSRILPVPEAEDFMVRPRSGHQTRSSSSERVREAWDWALYKEQLHFSQERIDIARRLVEELESEISARGLEWSKVFRKGFVVFNRQGGYNVVGVDLMWNRPVRIFLKLIGPPEDQHDLENPFPELVPIWLERDRQWGWQVDDPKSIASVGKIIDLAERFSV